MNLLKGCLSYTIGPLEVGDFNSARSWREYAKEKLAPLGIKILSPLDKVLKNYPQESETKNAELKQALKDGKYDYVHREMQEIRNRDLACCDVSTFLIAVLEPGIPSCGSIDEIITSKRLQKPVFLVVPELGYAGLALWMTSYFKPEQVYKSLDEVIDILYKIDQGEIEIDTKHWKLIA